MDFTDLGPAMTAAAARDSVEQLRADLALVVSCLLDQSKGADPKTYMELRRIASGK